MWSASGCVLIVVGYVRVGCIRGGKKMTVDLMNNEGVQGLRSVVGIR